MRLSLKIAWRFLASNKLQTVFIVLGIAVGVSVQVFIGTLITSLQTGLLDTTIGNSPHITVSAKESTGRISNYAALADKISAADSNIESVSPVADAAGFVKENSDTFPVLVRGFELDKADGIYSLKSALQKGSFPSGKQVMLGTDLMKKANLTLGDSIEILTPAGKKETVTISGVFDLKVASLNENWAISDQSFVQDLFEYGSEVTAIEMQVKEPFTADSIATSIESLLPSDLLVTNWKEQNAALLSGLNGQSVSSLMIQVFVMVSVVLGIASVLAISVLQKSKQLGILKAMGIKNRTASLIFLFQGLILGTFGALLGVLLGVGLTAAFTTFAVNPDGTPVVALYLESKFILISGLVAIAAATLASFIPARRSSKLDPMEVIKNG